MPTIAELLAAKAAAKQGKPAPGIKLGKSQQPPAPSPSDPQRDEARALGETRGEALDLTPTDATPEQAQWHSAAVALADELTLIRDPDPRSTTTWLAVIRRDCPGRPLYLIPLPLPIAPNPAPPGDPF